MGLSSKQVSSDDPPGWNQSLLPKSPIIKKQLPPQNQFQNQKVDQPMKCPRCDSSNTKFCYYNNYNKSQPRHFCKACKRHWTKGGSLRNVPIGGGRKNQRHKASKGIIKATSTVGSTGETSTATIKSSFMPHGVEGFSTHSGEVCEVQGTLQHIQYYPQSGFYLPTLLSEGKTRGLEFPFSSSSSFGTTPSSISTSFQSSSVNGDAIKDPTITSGSTVSQIWQVPFDTSCGNDMDMENYWNLDDIDALVSTDLNIPWDDSEIKLP